MHKEKNNFKKSQIFIFMQCAEAISAVFGKAAELLAKLRQISDILLQQTQNFAKK